MSGTESAEGASPTSLAPTASAQKAASAAPASTVLQKAAGSCEGRLDILATRGNAEVLTQGASLTLAAVGTQNTAFISSCIIE